MTKRRDKGSGGLYQRSSDGLWVGTIDIGWGEDGKRKRKTVSAKTKTEATRRLTQAQQELAQHGITASGSTTVKAYLEEWLTFIRVKPGTLKTYRNNVTQYLIPALGRRRLAQLEPQHVREMLRAMEKRGLAPSTVNGAHRVLRAALSDAVNDQRIPRNVAKNVTPPTGSKEQPSLTTEQAKTLLRSLPVTDANAARWAVAELLGIRQGEALGMEWNRVNLDAGTLDLSWQLQRIPYRHGCPGNCGRKRPGSCPQRELDVRPDFDYRHVDGGLCLTRPKSPAGYRVIPLPRFILTALANHHEHHGAALNGLVFTRDDGRPHDPSDDNAAWHAALTAAGLGQVKLHAARHTTATLLLELGVDPKVIQAILGHSTVAMTRAYQHASIEMQRAAMDSMGGLFEIEG